MKIIAAATLSTAFLVGCSSSTDYDFEGSKLAQQRSVPVSAEFDPSAGKFPLPNDLLFNGSQDGTINIPIAETDSQGFENPRVALNTMDGFSTTEPVVANFTQNSDGLAVTLLDASSVVLGKSVRIFEVTRGAQGQVTGIVEELGPTQVAAAVVPADPTVSANGSSVAIIPVQPLKERTTYMAIVTGAAAEDGTPLLGDDGSPVGVVDELGRPIGRGAVFGVLASGAPQEDPAAAGLQGLLLAMLAAAGSAEVNTDHVIMAWSFTTQSITPIMQALKDSATPRQITIDTNLGETSLLPGPSRNLANIVAGRMDVPYYMGVPSAENPIAAVTSFFKNSSGEFLTPLDNTAVPTGDVTIPVLMTVPKGTPPETGWPIAIFQHGINHSRARMLALADSMASVGFALIAIDLPLHGITSNDSDAALAAFRQPDIERHFDMDLVNNATRAPGPDGNVDATGTHFYNLANLLNTRDNNRQAVSDLFTLSASIGSLENIDASRKAFIGHSLGAMVGTNFLAFDDSIQTATLSSGGGGLPRLLAASPAYGPAIAGGLAAAGVDVNGPDGNAFLNAAQTIVDSADPINHAARVRSNNPGALIHMTQIVNDTVVVNNLAGFPLVGTEALARNMGLPRVTETSTESGFVVFEPGYHSSILSPAVDESNTLITITEEQALAIFTELQQQTAAVAAARTIVIENADVLAAPPGQ